MPKRNTNTEWPLLVAISVLVFYLLLGERGRMKTEMKMFSFFFLSQGGMVIMNANVSFKMDTRGWYCLYHVWGRGSFSWLKDVATGRDGVSRWLFPGWAGITTEIGLAALHHLLFSSSFFLLSFLSSCHPSLLSFQVNTDYNFIFYFWICLLIWSPTWQKLISFFFDDLHPPSFT